MHYYKFNIADWNLGTSHLSLVEEAIYFRLINFYYDTEQPIPLETQSVFRRLRIGNESDIAQSILDEFFIKTDRGYIHSRCDDLLKEYRKTAKNNRSNGAKGGRPRKDAASSETQTKPSGLFSETQTEPTHNPNQEPITNNQEPETKEKDITPSASSAAPKNQLDYSGWPEQPSAQTLADWLAMRKRLKANVSQTVINRFATELHKARAFGYTVDQCLAECVTRNWRGFEVQWILNSKQPAGGGHAGQPKSPIERFMQQHYPDAGQGFADDYRPMGGNDGPIRGAMDSELRGDAGQVGPVAPDALGYFSPADS